MRLPIRDAVEEAAFGAYVSRFVEARAERAASAAPELDAPFLMIRNEPQLEGELRVLTFQHRAAARAFATGWRRLRIPRGDGCA